jgi:AcrR family transcriptional regulator
MGDANGQRYEALWANVEPESSRKLLLAALDAFADRGFEAATTRDIAQRAGMSPAAVYVHYRSKLDLLEDVIRIGHEAVLEETQAAMREQNAPDARIAAFVEAFSAWHARFKTLARVTQYQLGSLPPDRYRGIRALRRTIERLLSTELEQGMADGTFDVSDVQGTVFAILSLGADVARWYAPDRGRDPEAIGRLHADLVLRMLR